MRQKKQSITRKKFTSKKRIDKIKLLGSSNMFKFKETCKKNKKKRKKHG